VRRSLVIDKIPFEIDFETQQAMQCQQCSVSYAVSAIWDAPQLCVGFRSTPFMLLFEARVDEGLDLVAGGNPSTEGPKSNKHACEEGVLRPGTPTVHAPT
jgi:hypothetical protein